MKLTYPENTEDNLSDADIPETQHSSPPSSPEPTPTFTPFMLIETTQMNMIARSPSDSDVKGTTPEALQHLLVKSHVKTTHMVERRIIIDLSTRHIDVPDGRITAKFSVPSLQVSLGFLPRSSVPLNLSYTEFNFTLEYGQMWMLDNPECEDPSQAKVIRPYFEHEPKLWRMRIFKGVNRQPVYGASCWMSEVEAELFIDKVLLFEESSKQAEQAILQAIPKAKGIYLSSCFHSKKRSRYEIVERVFNSHS